jgi:anaphase-promoting complex subunit 2
MPLQHSRKRIFSSIFPDSSSVFTTPTPVATPVTSFTAPGHSFGGPQDDLSTLTQSSGATTVVAEHIKWNRAWHVATSFLGFKDEFITAGTADLDHNLLRATWIKPPQPEALNAIKYLVSSPRIGSSGISKLEEDLVDWYIHEVRRHYLSFVRPSIRLVSMSFFVLSMDN